MTFTMLATRLGMPANIAVFAVTFFAYAFLGNIMECIVLSVEKKKLVTNRGFTSHLPFCIIYGAGALAGYFVLSPFADNLPLLYLMGALGATLFELIVGHTQQRLFGDFWWDYREKPFNYKGMLCLESTLGWGLLAIIIVRYLHLNIVSLVSSLPTRGVVVLAVALVLAYITDFLYSARVALREKKGEAAAVPESRRKIFRF